MKKASKSQMIEAVYSHYTNPGNLGNEKTEKEFKKRKLTSSMIHQRSKLVMKKKLWK